MHLEREHVCLSLVASVRDIAASLLNDTHIKDVFVSDDLGIELRMKKIPSPSFQLHSCVPEVRDHGFEIAP